MPMKKPPHLGGFIRREIIEPLGLSVTDVAAALGVTRQALSNLLNERTSLPAPGPRKRDRGSTLPADVMTRTALDPKNA